MTKERDEQIKNFAYSQIDCEFFDEKIYDNILLGAKWADEHPKEGLVSIDKACAYLESAIKPYLGYYAICDFVDTFRKIMEK